MALTKLTDVIVPDVFTDALYLAMIERCEALYASGIAETSDLLNAFLDAAGNEIDLPFVNQIVDEEATVVSDDETSSITPKKLTMGKNIAIKHNLAHAWSSARLAAKMSGTDPLGNVVAMVADFWEARLLARILASTDGVLTDDSDNDSDSMQYDVYTAGTSTDANKFSASAVIQTMLTMGDMFEDLTGMICHSVVAARMAELDLIDYAPDSTGRLSIPTYMGKRVWVTDKAYASGSPTKYKTIMFGPGAFSLGVKAPDDATEVYREPLKGDGGGVDTLVSRLDAVIHPNGMQFVSSGIAGNSPTIAELQAAAQWDKSYTRKRIKIAALISNG